MDQDRADWGAREYADALNRAETLSELFVLAREVNAKWAAPDDPGLAPLGTGGSTVATAFAEAPTA